MRRSSRSGPESLNTRVPVSQILSVGRQPHNKRQPYEAENIDNAFITLEKNIEKRPGFDVMVQTGGPSLQASGWNFTDMGSQIDLWSLRDAITAGNDLWYYWYSINEDSRFLVVVDYDATGATDKLFYNFHLNSNGTWQDVTGDRQWDQTDPTIAIGNSVVQAYADSHNIDYSVALSLGTLSLTTRNYITYKSGEKTAKEALKAVTLGANIVILNTRVAAGFSSDYTPDEPSTNGVLFDLNGKATGNPDIKGRRLQYYSASRVLEVFNVGEDGTSDTGDDVSIGFKIDPAVTGTIGAGANPPATTLTLEPILPTHSSILRSGSTIVSNPLSSSASSTTGDYVGSILSVKNPSNADASVLQAEIISYDASTKLAVCWDKSALVTGTIGADYTAASTSVNVGSGLDNIIGNYLKIKTEFGHEYRYITAYSAPTITIQNAFSADAVAHMTTGKDWEIVPYLVSVTPDPNLAITPTAPPSTVAAIRLGPDIPFSGNVVKGRSITIQGQTRTIISYNSGTGVATLSSALPSIPTVGTEYRITTGIGFGGEVVTVNGNTQITLPITASHVDAKYVGYQIQIAGAAPVIISEYTGSSRTVTFPAITSPIPIQGALVTITPPVSSNYQILPLSVSTDFYAGYTVVLTNVDGTTQTHDILSSSGINNSITIASPGLTTAITTATTYRITGGDSQYIPAGDFKYYKTELMHLGQLVDDVSSIRLPPEDYDWYANNSNLNDINDVDTNARVMLAALYDEKHPHKTHVNGRGKIYLTTNSYLNLTAGYYRVIDFVESEEHTILAGQGAGTSVTGTGRPYLQKVRTPEHWSYIDPARMPQKLSFTLETGTYTWTAEPIEWNPRDTGDNTTNPGPSIFRTLDGKSLKHTQIKSLAVFKNRLWFSADDVVFSSRVGQYENLFIADPTNIVETDPIDIRASSNTFAQITSMTPFEDYMFINTKADTQFQLMSSNANNGQDLSITPFNVVLSPSTYYAAATIIDPQLLGSQLYFFDKRRMYLFTGKNQLGFTSAVEISSTIADYLPENYGDACVASAHNTVFLTDADNPNTIYCYTIRFSGDRVIQSSFYRHILAETSSVQTIQAYDNNLYTVTKEGTLAGANLRLCIQTLDLRGVGLRIPRLDNKYTTILSVGDPFVEPNCVYFPANHTTVIRVPRSSIFEQHIVSGVSSGIYLCLADDWVVSTPYDIVASISNSILTISSIQDISVVTVGSVITGAGLPGGGVTITEILSIVGEVGTYRTTTFVGPLASQNMVATVTEDLSGTLFTGFNATISEKYVEISLLGNFAITGKKVYIGIPYLTTIELSEPFVRDPNNNVYHGTLNLRNCKIWHHNTGNYDILISSRGRTQKVASFTADRPDFTIGEDTLALSNIDPSGKFLASVLGYSDSTTIKLVSNYVTPMNIVDIEFMGKFKSRHTII